jgi:hypothetical protein
MDAAVTNALAGIFTQQKFRCNKIAWMLFYYTGSVPPPEKCHFLTITNFAFAGLIFLSWFPTFSRAQGVVQGKQQQQGVIKKHGNYSIVPSLTKPKGGTGETRQQNKSSKKVITIFSLF